MTPQRPTLTPQRPTLSTLSQRQDDMYAILVRVEGKVSDLLEEGLPRRVAGLESNWTWLVRSVIGLVMAIAIGAALAGRTA